MVGRPKTFLGMLLGLLPQRMLDLLIAPIQGPVVKDALAHAKYTACPADAVMSQFFAYLSLLAGR
jgi:hypothetical protein